MKITREFAMRLWFQNYGFAVYAEDFDGGLMYREAYGERNFFIWKNRERIYCGWNVHHILPVSCGGTNAESNLICTNTLQMMLLVTRLLTGLMELCIRSKEFRVQVGIGLSGWLEKRGRQIKD